MTETRPRTPENPPPGPSGAGAAHPLDRFFDLTGRGTTVAREVRGGVTTFVAMAYLVVLVPLIIGDAKDVTGAALDRRPAADHGRDTARAQAGDRRRHRRVHRPDRPGGRPGSSGTTRPRRPPSASAPSASSRAGRCSCSARASC